eukprot:763979-Hanusia_phi.AAC.4
MVLELQKIVTSTDEYKSSTPEEKDEAIALLDQVSAMQGHVLSRTTRTKRSRCKSRCFMWEGRSQGCGRVGQNMPSAACKRAGVKSFITGEDIRGQEFWL